MRYFYQGFRGRWLKIKGKAKTVWLKNQAVFLHQCGRGGRIRGVKNDCRFGTTIMGENNDTKRIRRFFEETG